MNQTSSYIFNLYHYMLTVRDTLEYCIDREHNKTLYDNRKDVLTKGIMPGSALGNFLENNKEQGDKIKEKINEFINEVYSENSTILTVSNDKIRVDHTQNLKILDFVAGLTESIRDIIYGYFNYAKSKNELEKEIVDLLMLDDRMYRSVFTMIAMREFDKSFGEFQKVMAESKGAATPQSNFIVQNEIVKIRNLVFFVREHHRCTDTLTLETLDSVYALIEMSEGRRERKDNKPFPELFTEVHKKLNTLVSTVEPTWKEAFQNLLKIFLEQNKVNGESKIAA